MYWPTFKFETIFVIETAQMKIDISFSGKIISLYRFQKRPLFALCVCILNLDTFLTNEQTNGMEIRLALAIFLDLLHYYGYDVTFNSNIQCCLCQFLAFVSDVVYTHHMSGFQGISIEYSAILEE